MSGNPSDWQDSLAQHRFDEAHAKLRALELIGQSNHEALTATTKAVAFLEALRAKNYNEAQTWLPINEEQLGIAGEPLSEMVAALEQGDKFSRPGGDLNQVVATLSRALAHPLTKAEAHNQLGVFAALSDDTQDARQHFEAALHTDPKHYRALTNLGNLEFQLGYTDAAIAKYHAAIAQNERYPTAHNNLAAAMKKKGLHGQAVNSLKRAQRLEVDAARAGARSGKPGKVWDNQWVRVVVVLAVLALLVRVFKR